MADRWTWVLETGFETLLPSAHRARGRRLVYTRNRAAEARLTLSLSDPTAVALFAELRQSIPMLVVYRNSTVVFMGHWTPMSGGNAIDENSHMELVFKDSFSLLDGYLTSAIYAATDAGDIAQDLIVNTDALFGLQVPIGLGILEATKVRDRTYVNKVVSEAIVELTEVQGGFDWYPTYTDPAHPTVGVGGQMVFNVVASYGSDRPDAVFEFGAGTLENCRGYNFTVGLPINVVQALGNVITSLQFDVDSTNRFGEYAVLVSATDVSEQATLDDKALDALRPDPVMVTAIQPDPARCPQPWDDFWIGDTIRWNVDDGAVQQQLEPRVQTVEIGLDESDNIDDLVIGIDPGAKGGFLSPIQSTRAYVTQQREILRRLSALER